MDPFYGNDIPFFDENGNVVEVNEANQWRFDEKAARDALAQMMAMPDDLREQGPAHVLTARQKAILAMEMPIECYMVSGDNRAFVPYEMIEHAANLLFEDGFNTEVLKQEVQFAGKASVRLPGATREKPVYRVIARAVARVTITTPSGRKVSHSAVGICGYDTEWETGDIMRAHKIAEKGAVTDARRTALQSFGRLFQTRGRDKDALLEAARQRHRLLSEAAGEKPAEAEAPKSGPQRAVSRRTRPAPRRAAPPAKAETKVAPVKAAPGKAAPEKASSERAAPAAAPAPAKDVKVGFVLAGADGAEIVRCATPAQFLDNYAQLIETAETAEMLDAIKANNAAILRQFKKDNAPALREAIAHAERAFEQHAAALAGLVGAGDPPPDAEPDIPDAPLEPDRFESAEPADVPAGEPAPDAAAEPPASAAPAAPAIRVPDLGEPDADDKGAAWARRLLKAIDEAKSPDVLRALMDRYGASVGKVSMDLMMQIAETRAKRERALAA